MSARGRSLLLSIASILLLVAIIRTPSSAYYPITPGATPLRWSGAAPNVSYLLHQDGSDDIADDAELTALRLAFDGWESISTSAILLSEDLSSDPSRTDFAAPDIHLIWFDENDASGLFSGASAAIALTPITYNVSTGQILDADIIFNGDDYTFSVDRSPGTYDVQSVAAHEIGHFIGLDHSGCLASTMYPFADDARTSQRSLSADDTGGASDQYPAGGTFGNISGFVLNVAASQLIRGAHVVALNDDGVVVTTTYSSSTGFFLLEKLPPADYTVYAEPLDGPVTGGNLSSTIGASATTSFQTTFLGGNSTPTSVHVTAGATFSAGTIDVGAASAVNLQVSGAAPYLGVRGSSVFVLIGGSGVAATDVIAPSGSGLIITSSMFGALGGYNGFLLTIAVDANAVLGPRNLQLTTLGGAVEILTGVIEVVDPAPTIASLSPTTGSIGGGESVTLTGTGFQSGALVLIGDAVAPGVVVDSSSQLTVTTPAAAAGMVDVHVQNTDGQLAIRSNAFTFISSPIVSGLGPAAGSTAGGTTVYIAGNAFLSGVTVDFGGSAAGIVSSTSTTITCITPASAAGAVDVVVTNPGGFSDTVASGFTYVVDPDPTISGVSPASGTTAGGTTITITGTHLDAAAVVRVGAALDGSGGTPCTSVLWLDANTITAVTPAQSAGTYSITVENPTGASATIAAAFTYQAPAQDGGGGGGGGCMFMPPIGGRGGWPPAGGALLPYFALMIIALLWRSRARVVRVRQFA